MGLRAQAPALHGWTPQGRPSSGLEHPPGLVTPLLSRPRLPLLSLYPSDPVSLLVCAGGVGAPGRTVSLFEVRAWVDRVSGRAVCWLGAGTGFQVFNSP